MSLERVYAYKCTWCNQLFHFNNILHEGECKFNPIARSCTNCKHVKKITNGDNEALGYVYCPIVKEVFKFPHSRGCPRYSADEAILKSAGER